MNNVAKKRKMAPANALNILLKEHQFSINGLARDLGLSSSTLYTAINNGEWPQAYEMACQLLVNERQATSKDYVVVCRVPPTKMEVLETFLKGLQINAKRVS